ncbi:protein kinase 2B, chloroplastic-like [Gossypium australe]|uniref:Protein kinase 2B, chloroplastic-like n=1 Tax=Gossypium australe TaxID=47621 RepID=A0A5B6UG42_9ROSI|nr:protein kinase 2B, chloroplastic-like [Gossypium australe]
MVQQYVQFGRLQNEDLNAHLANFLEIYDTFMINGIANDAIRLRLFLFSLRNKAKQWLNSLPQGILHSYTETNPKEQAHPITLWSGEVLIEPKKKLNLKVIEKNDGVEESKKEHKLVVREYKPPISYPEKVKKDHMNEQYGRPFLATARTIIDVGNGELVLRVGDEEVNLQAHDVVRVSSEQDDTHYSAHVSNHAAQHSL